MILTFRQRRCTNRGRNFVRSKRRPHYMSRAPLLIFCVLTIRKHLLNLSGRGPSICYRRPFCRLKAPLGLSLLRCAPQTRSLQTRNIKNCSAIYAQSEAERILNVFRQSVQQRGGGVVRNIQKLRGCLYFACGACTISTEYVCAEQESDRQSRWLCLVRSFLFCAQLQSKERAL